MKIKNLILNIALLAIISAGIMSCGGDEPSLSTKIEGKWRLITKEKYDCNLASDNKVYTCDTAYTYGFCVITLFNADGTYKDFSANYNTEVNSGEYMILDGNLILSSPTDPNATAQYRLNLSGNMMIWDRKKGDPYAEGYNCSSKYTYERL